MSHEHIVEDSPTMRSVAIAAPPLMPSMRPLTTKTTTPLKVSAAAPSLKTTDICNSFPELPVGYFLERTHVRIHDATPEQVMSRVESILARESVATHYDKNEVRVCMYLLATERGEREREGKTAHGLENSRFFFSF